MPTPAVAAIFEAPNSVLIIYLQMNLKNKKSEEKMKVRLEAVSSMAVCVPACMTRAGGVSNCTEPTVARHNLTDTADRLQ